MKKCVAVLISGGGSNLQALIDAAKAPDYPAKIALVISNVAAAFGLERAKNAGIPTQVVSHKNYPTREAFDTKLQEILKAAGVEIVCLAGFMRILTPEFVKKWEGRMLNIHPSILPKYKGLHTHKRALEAGETEHGCTVHLVSSELDSGAILAQASILVLPDDTEQSLAARVLEQEHRIYPATLKWLIESLP